MGKISEELLLALAVKNSGGGGGGTDDYNDLSNQPQINGNTLIGNKTASDLGLVAEETGKGLSTNDYTNEDKAIVGGVTAALAGKQDVLTAGKYIDIDENNEISVDPVVPNEAFTYLIEEPADYTLHVMKSVDGVVTFEETYIPTTWDVPIDVTLDNAIRIYTSLTGIMFYELVIASDTHDAGFKQNMQWFGRGSWTETFSTVDHSGEKLITKSELDTALATKADLTDLAPAFSTATAYTVGQYVSYDGNIYKCTSAHSAGAWAAGDFTLVAVGSELESKQNATDNSLQTTDKTVVGAVNELKSGLTNVADDVKLNTQDLTTPSRTKNLLPMTVDGIKAANTDGTWNGNAYTISGVTFTLLTDNDNNVIGIETDGTSTNDWVIFVLNADFALPAGTYAGNGVLGGNSSTYRIDVNCFSISITNGDILTTIPDTTSIYAQIVVRTSGTDVSNKTFYPMIRLSTETDPTFAPYIPSVESRIEAVESGVENVESELANLKFLPVNFTDTFEAGTTLTNGVTISDLTGGVLTNDSRIKGIVLYNVYPFYMFQLQYQGKIMLGTDVARTSQETITNRMVIMYI